MKTLVLSNNYLPIGAIEWQRAFVLVYTKKAQALSYYDKLVRSASHEHQVPSVIKVEKNAPHFFRSVRFNKRNLFLRDGGKCAYCQKNISYRKATYDHIIPKSKGGPTSWTNIAICCIDCNFVKKDRTPEEAGMILKTNPSKPAPISSLKSFMQRYKSRAPKAWSDWISV